MFIRTKNGSFVNISALERVTEEYRGQIVGYTYAKNEVQIWESDDPDELVRCMKILSWVLCKYNFDVAADKKNHPLLISMNLFTKEELNAHDKSVEALNSGILNIPPELARMAEGLGIPITMPKPKRPKVQENLSQDDKDREIERLKQMIDLMTDTSP